MRGSEAGASGREWREAGGAPSRGWEAVAEADFNGARRASFRRNSQSSLSGVPEESAAASEPPEQSEEPGPWRRRGSSVVQRASAFGARASLALLPSHATLLKASQRASTFGGQVAHLAALVIAENPLAVHNQYRQQQQQSQDEDAFLQPGQDFSWLGAAGADAEEWVQESWASPALLRWQAAVDAILDSAAILKDSEMLTDRFAHPADKFAAVVRLHVKLSATPQKKMLLTALVKQRNNSYDSFLDRFTTELFITGERIFHFFTPAKLGQHRLWFTITYACAMFLIFFFMIGNVPVYMLLMRQAQAPGVQACIAAANPTLGSFGYMQMWSWISSRGAVWCLSGPAWMLDVTYLIAWGARWGPLLQRQPYRWFSSWFLHQSFTHVLSNMLLFLAVGCQVEEKYGAARVACLWLFSALGGNFFSAAFENPCMAIVGASGGVFGMIGLYLGDMVMNFRSISREFEGAEQYINMCHLCCLAIVNPCPIVVLACLCPQPSLPILRSIMLVAFLMFFVVTVTTSPLGTSHLSHIGGFMCGLFPGFLLLPHLHSERWQAWLPVLGACVTLVIYVALPIYFYCGVLPNIGNCGLDNSVF